MTASRCAPATFPSLRGTTRITDNQVRDVGGRGVGLLAPVANLVVTGNLVERARHGIVMEERIRADAVTVSDNRVVDVGSREFDESDGVCGIQVLGARRASVESNVVSGVGQARQARGQSTGIDVLACVESHVGANAVDRVGFPESGGRDVGIAVRAAPPAGPGRRQHRRGGSRSRPTRTVRASSTGC